MGVGSNSLGQEVTSGAIPVGNGVSFSSITYSSTPAAGKLMQWSANGGSVTAPPSSSTATAAFGQVSLGVVKQNTLGYDILINVTVVVTAAVGGSVALGVGPTSPPATNALTNSLTLGLTAAFNAYIPSGYYFLLSTAGTITLGAVTTQVCPA